MSSRRPIGRTGRRLAVRGRRIGRRLVRSRAARRAAAAAAIVVVAFAVGVWGVIPYAVATSLERWAYAAPGRTAAATRVGVDPFELRLTLDGVTVGSDGATLSAERAVLDFGAAALLGRRIALDAVRIERAEIKVDSPREVLRRVDEWLENLRYRIERLEIDATVIEWPASSTAGAGRLNGVTFAVGGLDLDAPAPAAFEFVIGDAAGGRVRTEGEILPARREVSARVAVEDVDLGRVGQWIAGRSVADGTSSGSMTIDWRSQDGVIALRDVDLAVHDARLGEGFAASAVAVAGKAEFRADRLIHADLDAELTDGGRVSLSIRNAEDRAHDVALRFEEIPAAMIARHAERHAGRRIERGVIDAEIEYRQRGDDLAGVATLRGRGLELGASADPDEDARIAFGLALLENADGEAAMTVPFEANDGTRLPQALAETLTEHLMTIAERPFDALARAGAANGATLDAVSFRPGEAEPDPEGAEALAALADALLARPRIGIRVHGAADERVDRDALAAAQIELHVALETASAEEIARPKPIDLDVPFQREVLHEIAVERLGVERVETIASYFTRDASGAVVEAERRDYHRALFDALVENEAIPRNALERLARYRARAIAALLARHGVAEERIEIASPVVLEAGEPQTIDDEVRSVTSTLEAFLAADAALARSAGVVFNVADHD
ncbi:MAG: hypothetical protein C0P79_011160 [Gammaproteobacteria bacterium]